MSIPEDIIVIRRKKYEAVVAKMEPKEYSSCESSFTAYENIYTNQIIEDEQFAIELQRQINEEFNSVAHISQPKPAVVERLI